MKSTHCSAKSQKKKNHTAALKEETQQQESLSIEDKAQIIKKLKNIRKNRFKCSFQEFKGVSPSFNVEENQLLAQQWTNKKIDEDGNNFNELTYENPFQMILGFITMITFSFTVWRANLDFFFSLHKRQSMSSLLYIAPVVLIAADLIFSGKLGVILSQRKLQYIVKQAYKPGFCLFYLILKINELSIAHEVYWLVLEVPCLIHLYSEASKLYQAFRVMTLSKKYEYHVKSFDLIFSLAILAHIIAIVLYRITIFEASETWLSKLKIDTSDPIILYIYSFYFGCTTILTVGYGDIVPVNHVQIAVVCGIELFGIAIFAYLISEIGYNLSNLRKDREVIEKDLSILEKCKGYYKISPEIVAKTRSNLLNCQQAINRLKPEEEKALISKLSEPLRQEMVSFNNLSIIKSSIFFLCRWSKNFQLSLSKQLISALYMPGESFFQPQGKERIYIVRIGKVDIYRKGKGNKRETEKIIKSLKINLKTEVSDNSFGYTAVIGRKPTQLEVVSSHFTSTYFVDKEAFLKCLVVNSGDYEYYHEIKDKIEQSTCPEALEAPVLQSRRYHYSPMKHCLIKHYCSSINQLKNKRGDFIRSQYRHSRQNIVVPAFKSQGVDKVQKAYITSIDEIALREQIEKNEDQTKMSVEEAYQSLGNRQTSLNRTRHDTIKHFIVKQKEFNEVSKEFKNYYPAQNLETIIKKYDCTLVEQSRYPEGIQPQQVLLTIQNKFCTLR